MPVYGSGGFTSYSDDRLREQLGGWVSEGIPRVKMKVGREPEKDPERVGVVRRAVGEGAELVEAHLARREMQLAVEEWLRVIPDFDIATGQSLSSPRLKVRTYPVTVEDGQIKVTV